MSTETTADPRGIDDLPGWVRRTWLVPLLLGIAMAVLGLILMFNLAASVDTLRWLVVIALAFAAADAFATASQRAKPWLGWLVGAAYVAGAIAGIVWPGVTLFALVITVGASLFVGGIVQAIVSWRLKDATKGWGWGFALGLLSVVAGLVFLFGSPVISVAVLAIVLAVHVFTHGITLIVLALAVRRAAAAIGDRRDAKPRPA
jgi:uncharacterized membrane protein HdeD (DUF308 family)